MVEEMKIEIEEVTNNVTRTVYTTNLEDDYLINDIIISLVEGYDDEVDCEVIIQAIIEKLITFEQFTNPVLFKYSGYKIQAQRMGEYIVAAFVSPNTH